MRNIVITVSLLFALSACVSNPKVLEQNKQYEQEIVVLKEKLSEAEKTSVLLGQKNKKLKADLDNALNGPPILLSKINSLIESGEGESAKKAIDDIQKRYPHSEEAKTVKLYAGQVNKLIKAEHKKLRDEEKKNALKKHIYTSEDKLEGITWYHSKLDKGKYRTRLVTYFGKKENKKPWFRMKLRYYGDDWLFIKSYFFVVDGERYNYDYAKFTRDNSSGSIWEWNDRQAKEREIKLLKHIVKSDSAVVRFVGQKYHSDYTVSREEKKAIQHVLDAFEETSQGN